MMANDVDVYYGDFTTRSDVDMAVFMDQIKYKSVEGFAWEINTVKCSLVSFYPVITPVIPGFLTFCPYNRKFGVTAPFRAQITVP